MTLLNKIKWIITAEQYKVDSRNISKANWYFKSSFQNLIDSFPRDIFPKQFNIDNLVFNQELFFIAKILAEMKLTNCYAKDHNIF